MGNVCFWPVTTGKGTEVNDRFSITKGSKMNLTQQRGLVIGSGCLRWLINYRIEPINRPVTFQLYKSYKRD